MLSFKFFLPFDASYRNIEKKVNGFVSVSDKLNKKKSDLNHTPTPVMAVKQYLIFERRNLISLSDVQKLLKTRNLKETMSLHWHYILNWFYILYKASRKLFLHIL